MNTPLPLAIALVLVLAGCIAVPEDAESQLETAAVEPDERVDGMTVEETHTDAIVDCNEGGTTLPPGVCAERVLLAQGRIGVDTLPVELIGSNGEISIRPSEGDEWSFSATIRVRALTEDFARRGLDSAWTWTHERDGEHVLVAGPTPMASVDSLTASVASLQYELELPAWIVLDIVALTDNGAIGVSGFETGSMDLTTDNGQIVISGKARDVRASTDNGEIVATLTPIAVGNYAFTTDNGQVILRVPEGRSYGYDIEATTDNGQVIIQLSDGDVRMSESGATFRTTRFDERQSRASIAITTDNGQVVVTSG